MTDYTEQTLEHVARALDSIYDAMTPQRVTDDPEWSEWEQEKTMGEQRGEQQQELDPLYGTTTDFGALSREQVDALVEHGASIEASIEGSPDVRRAVGYAEGIAAVLVRLTGVSRLHVTSPVTGWTGDVDWRAIFRMRNILDEQVAS